MKVKDLINLNFGISGPIGIKDVDDLADEKITILMDGVKDKEIKKYYDWEVVAQFPLFVKLDREKKMEEVLLFWRAKKYKQQAEIEYRPIIVLAVCNHIVSEPVSEEDADEEDDVEIPKNYK